MPARRPRRRVYDDDGHSHYLTFSCHGRRKLLNQDRCKRIVLHFMEECRAELDGIVFGFVIMPEHLHALVRFRAKGELILFKQEWKRRCSLALYDYFDSSGNPVAKYLVLPDGSHRIWTPKQYDFNIWSREKVVEKLEYMHKNPVERRLCLAPCDWTYSSARWYADRRSVGVTLTHIDE